MGSKWRVESLADTKKNACTDVDKGHGLSKDSVIDCFQIRSISLERVAKHLGHAEPQILDDVKYRLALILDIGEEHVG